VKSAILAPGINAYILKNEFLFGGIIACRFKNGNST
jgi:hypothetical protein